MMASVCNPIGYIVDRQYNAAVAIKNKLFKERLNRARNLYRKDLLGHYGCVNAIEFSDEGELLISGGDDRRVLLWSISAAIFDQGSAITMETRHFSNIFCLSFDSTNSKIFSGGNDDQVLVHDAITGHIVRKLPHVKPVYGLSVNPENDSILATAGDDGRILICDIREPNGDSLILAKQKMGFHSVKYNPMNAKLLVTANSEEGIALWDIRKPREVYIHYDGQAGPVSGISACFNSDGTRVLALRRRLPPALYASHTSASLCQFYHPHYYNSCTMKTCSFAGDSDEYVLSGSDDFNLYMWKVPEEDVEWGTAHLVLNGHRSIVNQVRYNKQCNLIASSGVEKMVKLWSTLPIGTWSGSLQTPYSDTDRPVYSHDEYIYLVGGASSVPIQQQSTPDQQALVQQQPPQQQRITHDYSEHSTQEDARMMAFFDSLIQREIEGWESRSEDTFTSDSDSDTFIQEKIRLSWQSLLQGRKQAEENTRKRKPNRIAQLIAQKRNRLAKMAHWKSKTLVQRILSVREKHNKRASKHIHKFRPKDSRHSSKYTTTSSSLRHHHHHRRTATIANGSSANQTNSSAAGPSSHGNKRPRHSRHSQHVTVRRQQCTRSAARQRERQLFEMLESMPDNRSMAAGASSSSSSSSNKENAARVDVEAGYSGGDKKRTKRGETDRNLREECNVGNNYQQEQQHIIDMPSTSTGITSASSHSHVRFRHGANAGSLYDDSDDELVTPRCGRALNNSNSYQAENDAEEEEVREGQLVNILPTPLNGTHNVYVNVMLEVSAAVNNDNVANVVSVGTNTDLQSSDSDTESFEDSSYAPTQAPERSHNRLIRARKNKLTKTNPLSHSKRNIITNKGRGKSNNRSFIKRNKSTNSAANNDNFKESTSSTNTGQNNLNSTKRKGHIVDSNNLTAKRKNNTAPRLSSTTTNSSSSSSASSSSSSSSTSASSSNDDEVDRHDESAAVNNHGDNLSALMMTNDFIEGNSDSDSVLDGGGNDEAEVLEYAETTIVGGDRFDEGGEDMVTPIKRISAKKGGRCNRTTINSGYSLASSSAITTTTPSSRYYRKRHHQHTNNKRNNQQYSSDDDNNANKNLRNNNSCSSSDNNSSSSSGGSTSGRSNNATEASSSAAAAAAAATYYQRVRKQRAKRARLNLRKQMQINGDSDSN